MEIPPLQIQMIELNIIMRTCQLEALPLLNELFVKYAGRNHERYDRFFKR